MATVDLTIRGAGVFGLSVAYAVALRGARVRVVDPRGVGAGASGGIVGALAPHVPENWNPKKAFQFESLRMSEPFWRGVEARSGQSTGYARTGRVQAVTGAAAIALAETRGAGADALWQGFADWTVSAQSGDLWHLGGGETQVVRDTLTARLFPRKTVEALAAAIRSLGGDILTEAAQEGPELWATGAEGLAEMSMGRDRVVGAGVKGQAVLLAFAAPEAAQVFIDGMHFVPHEDGTLAVGSTSERVFDDGTATDDLLDDLLSKARRLLPVIKEAPVLARWAGVRPRARSRAPMLGQLPDAEQVYIANGGFKIGFGMAPKVAEVMADLILEGRDAIPEGFRVEDNL